MMFGRNLFYFVFFFSVCISDDSMEKTAKAYFELLNKGIRPEKPVPFFPQPRIFKRSARTLKKQTKVGAPLPISEHDLQNADKTSGEDGQHGNSSPGQNGDGQDGQEGTGLTGHKGDDEARQKGKGSPGQNGDDEDGQKGEGLTGEKGDDETRQKGKGSPTQNGDGEDGQKGEGLTGEKGDDETRQKGKGSPGQNGDDGTREGNGEEPPFNQATGDDNNANREGRYSSRRGPEASDSFLFYTLALLCMYATVIIMLR